MHKLVKKLNKLNKPCHFHVKPLKSEAMIVLLVQRLGYGWMMHGSVPSRDKRILSSPKRPDRLWGALSLLFNGYQVFFPWGVKWLQGEVCCSPPSSAKAKNECSYTATPLHTICLHGLERENFTLY